MSELEELLYKIKVKKDKTKDDGIREKLNTSIKLTEEIIETNKRIEEVKR